MPPMRGAVEQGPVNRAEWRWALGWALAVAALTCVPYLYAYFAVPAFGSGLAVVSLLIGRNDAAFVPVDLFVPEAIGFYSTLANPHFPFAFALQIWAILWTLHPPRANLWTQIAVATAIGLGIVALAPYLTPIVWVAVAAGVAASRPNQRDAVFRGDGD